MRRWAGGFTVCMLGVAAVARFIEPDGWATWMALSLLAVALVCATKVARIMRREWTDDQDKGS